MTSSPRARREREASAAETAQWPDNTPLAKVNDFSDDLDVDADITPAVNHPGLRLRARRPWHWHEEAVDTLDETVLVIH
jgi:hypothetical protein